MSDRERNIALDESLLDLLVKEITDDLAPEERQLLDQAGGDQLAAARRELAAAAGAVALAASFVADGDAPPTLPAALQARIARDALSSFEAHRADVIEFEARHAAPPLPSYSAWWVAAACLLVGAFGWLRSPPAAAPPEPAALAPAPSRTPTLAEQRRELLAGATAVTLALGATKDPAGAGVSGDVVWDPGAQRGYIRFVGLAPNDPRERQYQVWIFDAARDPRYPVDGGVFDIPAGQAEVVVPIHAKIPVAAATAFAVTLEKAGGVVVSARDRVVALAKAT